MHAPQRGKQTTSERRRISQKCCYYKTANVNNENTTIMKKYYLPLAAAATMFAGCANDDVVVSEVVQEVTGPAITFGSSNVSGQTRATLSGSAAAGKLNGEFVVYGTKHTAAEDKTQDNDLIAFQNYKVTYNASSAGATESNTHNWEYVGVAPYASTKVSPAITSTSQTVKYWDYSATQGYTFTAFAGKTFLDKDGAKVNKILGNDAENATKYDKGYTVTIPSGATLDEIFFSDRVEVEKSKFGNPVVLTFRNFGAKVRVGFYETVPGYSVKIDKFYYDGNVGSVVTSFTAMNTEVSDGTFKAALQNVNSAAADGNTVKVTYYGDNAANQNQAKVNSGSSSTYQYTFTLGTGITNASLSTVATNPTWDTSDGDHYTTVYPNLDNTNPMLIRCDYTLTADDGSGETIKVKNARVTVPTQYVQWKSNYAYTYLFKISNNTNGTTGDPAQDKEGLYPITFDAVVVEATDYRQETTTTVASNSVTSYAKDGYTHGKDVYFVNTNTTDHSVICPAAVGDNETGKAQVYSVTGGKSEAEILAYLTGSTHNGVTLTAVTTSLTHEVPSADGTMLVFGEDTDGKRGAAKFTPSAAGTYVYVYCTTKYVAPTYEKVGDSANWDDAKTYYYKTTGGVYYTASGISADNFAANKSNLYTQTSAGTPGVYDVKVITVN